ncbi:MAG: hypothetical protein HY744_05945, partial [Deltaproteobacteria bacterium]|nr:hypothetical protein [Deltaproteobacteria bacterium]
MRIRNDTLSAGSLLASLDPDRPENNHGLLFLVAGADDIEPLTEIERTCRDFIEGQEQPLRKGFAWYAVSSYGQDGPMDPRGRVPSPKRLEVREFHGLARADLEKLLHPVLDRLARGEPELLPSAGAAVGAPAEGVQFLDRTSELGELLRLLRGGKSVILLAPRRSGKTSLMRRAQVVLESECRLVSLNLERDNTPEKVAARLRTIVSGEPFRQALGRVQGDPTGSIRQSIEDLARRATPSHPLVLLLDELVALLDNRPVPFDENVHRRGALGFLQAIAEPAAKLGARCAVAGSVDLFHYLAQTLDLAQEDLPTLLREIVPLHLKPLALDSPEIELRRVLMGSGLVLEPAEVSWLVEHVDLALPFPAMKLLDRLTAQSAAPPGLTLDDGRRLLADFV